MDESKKNKTEVNEAYEAIKRAFSERFCELVDKYLEDENRKINDEYEQKRAVYDRRLTIKSQEKK